MSGTWKESFDMTMTILQRRNSGDIGETLAGNNE